MLRRAGATTTGKYSLMLRDGGNALGSSILSNLGIGGKSNFGMNKNSMLKVLDKDMQENVNSGNNNINYGNYNMKEFSLRNIDINDENNQQNNDEE